MNDGKQCENNNKVVMQGVFCAENRENEEFAVSATRYECDRCGEFFVL